MSLINREALYEKACDLEAQALAYIGKIANDKTKIEEWKIWSAILIERTGFKHDIFDAPEELPSAQPEPKTGEWNFVGNQMFECTSCGVAYTEYQFEKMRVRYNDPKFPRFCPNCGARMEDEG